MDEIAFFIFVCAFLLSLLSLFLSLQRERTKKGLRHKILKHWVEFNLQKSNAATVQHALRNHILINSAFISGLLVLIGLIVGFSSNIFADDNLFLWGISGVLTVGFAQMATLLLIIIIALFSFVNANRMLANLSYLLTSDIQPEESEKDTINYIKNIFRLSQRSWMIGIRAIFFIVIAFLWLLNNILFLVATISLLLYLVSIQDLNFWAYVKRREKKSI